MKPLTIEQLKSLEEGDWVWVVYKNKQQSSYEKLAGVEKTRVLFYGNDLSTTFATYGKTWLAYKNKEQAEAKGEIVELPCKVGSTVYRIVKFCEKCIPERYREEYKPFAKFDNDCEYYEASFYESAERCKEREEYDSEREDCSLNLNTYCDKCKQRLAIQKDLFTLGKLNQVYGTKQYNSNTPLEDTYFLVKEEAESRLKELQLK